MLTTLELSLIFAQTCNDCTASLRFCDMINLHIINQAAHLHVRTRHGPRERPPSHAFTWSVRTVKSYRQPQVLRCMSTNPCYSSNATPGRAEEPVTWCFRRLEKAASQGM